VAEKIRTLAKGSSTGGHLRIESVECPNQGNSSDCGVYVLAFSEELGKSGFNLESVLKIDSPAVAVKRTEILTLLDSLIAKKKTT